MTQDRQCTTGHVGPPGTRLPRCTELGRGPQKACGRNCHRRATGGDQGQWAGLGIGWKWDM